MLHQQLEKTVAGSWAGPATEASTVPALQSFHQSTNHVHPPPNTHPPKLNKKPIEFGLWGTYLKGPQLEIFVAVIFTQSRPVWVGTKPKNSKSLWLGPYTYPFIGEYFLALSATALKNTKWRFASQNHKLFKLFGLVPKSPTHTGLICVKTSEPNITSLGPFKNSCICACEPA
jgi:hypothetical protein